MLRFLIKSCSRLDLIRCFCSAGLLVFAFPKINLWILAWGSLVPLMFVLDGKKPLSAFRWAYMCGVLFFTGTLYWFFHITKWFSVVGALGIVLLLLYLALYFGLFGLAYSLFSRQKSFHKLFLFPSIWVVLEFIRAHLFTGFDWASLGHTQYTNLPVIQIADITGVFGVSFIVMMVNVLIKELLTASFVDKTPQAHRTTSLLMWTTVVSVVFVLGYGMFRLYPSHHQDRSNSNYSIAIIQANIPQEVKWEKTAWGNSMKKYVTITKQALQHDPDLIIWPETSYPGYLWDDKELFIQLQAFVRSAKTPLLLGSVLKEEHNYYNSAILLSSNGDIDETYRKVHLVPFGEYLPLRAVFPFLSSFVPIGDFTAGDQWTIFSPGLTQEGDQPNNPFSVLICFEDTVARLSRKFVQHGAQLLVNITNDAWFGNTRAPFMHLQSAVFRTVENRRGLVRAANTGVSCFIDQWGQTVNCVESNEGSGKQKTYISGYSIEKVDFNDQITFYTKFGDIFTIFCFGCILWGIMRRRVENSNEVSTAKRSKVL